MLHLKLVHLWITNGSVSFSAVTPTPGVPQNPCQPSPCGPNSECQVRGGNPACSCLQNYIGSPPNCRPECTINPECSSNLACVNQKCSDPCPGSCGANARCNVVNHTPVCSCNPGFTGDPFNGCVMIQGRTEFACFLACCTFHSCIEGVSMSLQR
jgi:hypothetical protein